MDQEDHWLAVLIDAENAQLSIPPELLAAIAKIGSATVKRIYGDFTCLALASWREHLASIMVLVKIATAWTCSTSYLLTSRTQP